MTGWTTRELGPDDLAVVLAADVFDGPATVEWTQRFLGRPGAADPLNILVVAEQAGRVLGFASGTVLAHPDKAPALFVNELGVHERERRRGVGKDLLSALRAAGRARGCRVTWVATEGDNTAARALYHAAGGAETGGIVMYEWEETDGT